MYLIVEEKETTFFSSLLPVCVDALALLFSNKNVSFVVLFSFSFRDRVVVSDPKTMMSPRLLKGIDVSKNTSLIDYREMIKEKIKKNLSVTKKKNEPSLVNTQNTKTHKSSRKKKKERDNNNTVSRAFFPREEDKKRTEKPPKSSSSSSSGVNDDDDDERIYYHTAKRAGGVPNTLIKERRRRPLLSKTVFTLHMFRVLTP